MSTATTIMVRYETTRAAVPRATRWTFFGLALCVSMAGLVVGGCGDDAPAPASPPRSAAPKTPNAGQPAGPTEPKKGSGLQFYPKIEDFAADEEESKRLRHTFAGEDFEPDVTGDENRDPFRSYVIRQPGVGPQQAEGPGSPNAQADLCNNKNLVAPSYSLRDLRLVGIVLRGTKSYALFRDSASYGHIVRKGDCLGQEKARVAAIRTGFVSLEVIPEVAPNQQPKPPQERAIQLYPEELPLEPVK